MLHHDQVVFLQCPKITSKDWSRSEPWRGSWGGAGRPAAGDSGVFVHPAPAPQVVGQVRKSQNHHLLQVSPSSRSPAASRIHTSGFPSPLQNVSSPAEPAAQVSHRSRRGHAPLSRRHQLEEGEVDRFDHQSCTGEVSSFIFITDQSFIQTFYLGTPVMFNNPFQSNFIW